MNVLERIPLNTVVCHICLTDIKTDKASTNAGSEVRKFVLSELPHSANSCCCYTVVSLTKKCAFVIIKTQKNIANLALGRGKNIADIVLFKRIDFLGGGAFEKAVER